MSCKVGYNWKLLWLEDVITGRQESTHVLILKVTCYTCWNFDYYHLVKTKTKKSPVCFYIKRHSGFHCNILVSARTPLGFSIRFVSTVLHCVVWKNNNNCEISKFWHDWMPSPNVYGNWKHWRFAADRASWRLQHQKNIISVIHMTNDLFNWWTCLTGQQCCTERGWVHRAAGC